MLAAAASTAIDAGISSSTCSSSSSGIAGVDQRHDSDQKQADDPIDDGGNVVRFRAGRSHAEGALAAGDPVWRCCCCCCRRRRRRQWRVVQQVEVQPKVGPRLAAKRQRQGGVRWSGGAVHVAGAVGAVAAAVTCRPRSAAVCCCCLLCCRRRRPIGTIRTVAIRTSTTGLRRQRPALGRHGGHEKVGQGYY